MRRIVIYLTDSVNHRLNNRASEKKIAWKVGSGAGCNESKLFCTPLNPFLDISTNWFSLIETPRFVSVFSFFNSLLLPMQTWRNELPWHDRFRLLLNPMELTDSKSRGLLLSHTFVELGTRNSAMLRIVSDSDCSQDKCRLWVRE